MIEKEIKRIKICGTVKYELPLDEDARFPPTDSTFSCLIPGLGAWFTGHVIQDKDEEAGSAPTGQSLEENQNEETLEHRFENLEKLCVEHFFECNKVQTDIDEAHIKKTLEERIENIEIALADNDCWKQSMNLNCIKRFENVEEDVNELKQAFEGECDHYDANIKSIKQAVSDLQQAFVKYAICKDTESPQGEKSYTAAEPITPGEFVYSSSGGIIGYAVPKKTADEWKAGIPDHPSGITEQVDIHVVKVNLSTMTAMEDSNPLPPQEPDIVEQIKAGENRLWELRKSVDCVAAIANSASETVSLKEHVIKLMSIHTGLNITGIRMCNKTYKIHYNCKEKGIYVELD